MEAKMLIENNSPIVGEKPKYKVLVVEDNELNLKLFRDLLTTYHFQVIDTKDGFEAVSLIKAHHPDVVVMDIQLRGVSGFDIIQEIKQDDSIKHIPIIAVTAFAMKDDQEKIMASGCEAYIAKPISIVSFIDTVNKFLPKK
jgi:two-component system cell cycle response regulator DivK